MFRPRKKQVFPVQNFIDENSRLFEEIAKKLNVGFDIFKEAVPPLTIKLHGSFGNYALMTFTKKPIPDFIASVANSFMKKWAEWKRWMFWTSRETFGRSFWRNYFFKLSKYEKQIRELIEKDKLKIYPAFRKTKFWILKEGLKTLVFRAPTKEQKLGVEVPNDTEQRMYVWFDALNIYQSGSVLEATKKNTGNGGRRIYMLSARE